MKKWISPLIRIALGAVFVVAAVSKISDPPTFAHMIYNYRLVPGWWINALALVMPWVELLCGVALIAGFWRRSAASILGVLLVVFMIAIGINIARDNAVNCGCFNLESLQRNHADLIREMWWVLLRDVGLLAMVCYIIVGKQALRASES